MTENKQFKYKILSENKLIVESWIGEFSLKEILEFKNIEASDPEWKDYYDVLADDRLSTKKIEIFNSNEDTNMDYYQSQSQKFVKKRKTALLTNLPQQVVTSIFLQDSKPKEALVQLEIFSTLKAALTWLEVDLNETDKINRILEHFSVK